MTAVELFPCYLLQLQFVAKRLHVDKLNSWISNIGGGKVPKTMWRKCRNVKFRETLKVFFKVWMNRVKQKNLNTD